MRSTMRALTALASVALIAPSAAQTWSNCNPTLRSDCPPDSALGRTVNIDFSSESESFTPQGNPTYGDDGVSFTIRQSGDAPQLTSLWYIMFGKVDIEVQAAPGAGIVSSFVLQSDTLDEIDWEWLGADPDEVQSNYFGKGQTTDYNRGAFHADPGSQSGFKKYTIEWTPEQIVWQINGETVRTLEPANANNQYPQTPMQIKFGAWSGGDSANPAGTISWARGPTDYSQGPFSMKVKSLMVQDYSTGTQYVYGDQSGTSGSIRSVGGTVFSGGNAPIADAPAITATATGQPLPFTPHQTSDYTRPSVYPWIPDPSATPTAQPTFANYPGLPSGWTVSDSGKVVPPSSATMFPPGSYTSSPQALPTGSYDNGPKTVTGYDDRGFTTIRTIYPATTPAPTSNGLENAAKDAVPAAPAQGASWKLMVSSILPWVIVLIHIPGCIGL
ncbi:concanavalin A-like lectin/glucanase domain-containing protein [Alternaria rosae]|uniref:concanavalin A-like lectin/glucanase domain-containing protein n=1 Tax=Alternaria rosae TaxID=1187941 RepID=UPI001E8E3752|nr:concanavalin A-like lectin/glucanase domain-containing protein [Alternaria rosae]KAH6882090.1 concanavalin A-like lectin/glucanase domain-containing protein [Alternaria rosae]